MKSITDLQTKNRDFIPRYVYDTSNLSAPERLKIVSCVCNTTAISWKMFTKFYIVNENSTKWHIEYNETAPDITLPMNASGYFIPYDLPTTTVRTMQGPATSDTFCPIASLWPSDKNTSSWTNASARFCDFLCVVMSGRLFAFTKEDLLLFKNPEILLESPTLLTPKVLRTLVVQHARGESL